VGVHIPQWQKDISEIRRQASSRRIGQHDTDNNSAWELGFENKKPVPTFEEHTEMWLSLPHDWKRVNTGKLSEQPEQSQIASFRNNPC